MMKKWYDKYINVPYENFGRLMTGADCWGLVVLVYEQELGIQLPTYAEISAESLIEIHRKLSVDKDSEIWETVTEGNQKPFDVCVMTAPNSKRVCHVGIVIDEKHILHIEKGVDSAIVPVNHFTIRERIACYRRHK